MEPYEHLFRNFSRYDICFSPEEILAIESLFVQRKFRKNQYILQQGDMTRHETFICRGLTRTYEVDEKGVEHVLFFGPEEWWVGDLYSFLCSVPSQYNVDCLEETEVLQITRSDLESLYVQVPRMNQYFRILFQNAYISLAQRASSSLSKPALQRYLEFQEKYPHIGARVPDHQIASYLGITPQSLSRIRRQLAG
ncbi:MAG: Crp/Fnr family transcriptional regulator [Bacteroidota bacterium]|nr:Crp/Fnr family transcriptional regulator [Bacteroidota bacterium]MDP4256533.1 Crp/Fnr family transcriptional regulator [Bacteroidota bacterium]MDP4260276.1 Crp/Fnr family transcriptional regulator [Bacteroidota bacterium]